MRAWFESVFSCSPRETRSNDLQIVQQTIIAFPVMAGTNRDCNQNNQSAFNSTAYRPAAGPRAHL